MSSRLLFQRVRKELGRDARVVLATTVPPAVDGRPDDYRLVPSKLIEDDHLDIHPVGGALACPEPIAFLDGTQRVEVVGYVEATPIVAAIIAAAVRLRTGGHFATLVQHERSILMGRPDVLESLDGDFAEFERVPVPADDVLHPLKALEGARRVIDIERGRLEREVGRQFRQQCQAWLVVDGVIADSGVWQDDSRAIGVSKSHATLPFGGGDLERYLTLPNGHRTSVFEPATWRIAPVRSWGLRLWPHEGHDLFHGLVRVEVAVPAGTPEHADLVSRWLLAERAPLSRPDTRWDRLLYGVAAVERHLRAR